MNVVMPIENAFVSWVSGLKKNLLKDQAKPSTAQDALDNTLSEKLLISYSPEHDDS